MSSEVNEKTVDVAVLVGSLRKASFSLKVARALIDLAKAPLALSIVEIGNLPLFNEDDEAKPPSTWVEFRERIGASKAVLFVTPEYNRSVPAVLKNAVDVGSRPQGQSVWAGKPGGVVSVTPYGLGGFGANHHLRQSLVYLDVPTLQQPEIYISHADKLFDESDKLKDEKTRALLEKFLGTFTEWIAKTSPSKKTL